MLGVENNLIREKPESLFELISDIFFFCLNLHLNLDKYYC